ncbi:fibronectin type III domain-containing protein [Niastella populi]|nr:fibronectin type III domain-containing protein [Niastella populi]
MKSNPSFPNPPAAMAEFKKVLPELDVALVNAKSRDKQWIAIKNNKKTIALTLLEEVAAYVISVSKGDRALIFSSGFEVIDEQSGPINPSIKTLEVALGAPGEAILRIKNQKGAISYVHQYSTEAPGPNTVWHSVGSTIGNHTFTGLSSDKRYWFRVIAVARKGKQAYSPVISRSIQ